MLVLNFKKNPYQGCLSVSPHGEFAPSEFTPTSTPLAIKCFKFIFLMPRKKDNIVPDELEIESLDEFMGANSPWGETGINPIKYQDSFSWRVLEIFFTPSTYVGQ